MATKVQKIKSKIEHIRQQAEIGKLEAQGVSGSRYAVFEEIEKMCTKLLDYIDSLEQGVKSKKPQL